MPSKTVSPAEDPPIRAASPLVYHSEKDSYFRINKSVNTRVEKTKHPKAKLRSVFLEMVITTSLHCHYQGGKSGN
jgi:hypothetical protein